MPPNLPFTELTPALISLAFMISLRVIPVIAPRADGTAAFSLANTNHAGCADDLTAYLVP